ncbi:activator of basal transcription 1-like [Mizuhopecten yessoensis]|uniref:Activator of basal transcription 1 n=1 Tax=Mizuhopecten yessoensis TaxID=6573 RepID=A0A210PEN7_MIZYE|nr:activator of basal transcription 1-like [Mizuhopecten yessoensis]OWF34937.1 Activator of basal transcription 1 [Mizuhopecten yessoensis]
MADTEHTDSDNTAISSKTKQKKKNDAVPGVIYLSRIPPFMNVKKIRDIFSEYGDVERIFLQPNERGANTKKGRLFTEGWLEFSNKKVAKYVALTLNNSNVGGKKSSQWYDELWNIKYLHRFKWAHLNERLAYEKEVRKQRMRTAISQVKRQAQFHIRNAEGNQVKQHIQARKRRQGKPVGGEKEGNEKLYVIAQKDTEEDKMLNKKRKLDGGGDISNSKRTKKKDIERKKSVAGRSSFLKNIFSGGIVEGDS